VNWRCKESDKADSSFSQTAMPPDVRFVYVFLYRKHAGDLDEAAFEAATSALELSQVLGGQVKETYPSVNDALKYPMSNSKQASVTAFVHLFLSFFFLNLTNVAPR
jgi:hypothetical protein